MTMGEDGMVVENVAKTFVAALARTDLRAGEPGIGNVGTGKPQTLRTFAEFWWKEWNAKGKLKVGVLPYRANEVMRYVPKL